MEIPERILALDHDKDWQFAVRFFGSHDYAWLSHANVILWTKGDEKGRYATGFFVSGRKRKNIHSPFAQLDSPMANRETHLLEG